MNILELDEDDVIRIEDDGEERVYIFRYKSDRECIYKMYDSDFNGERPDDFESYTQNEYEIALVFPMFDDPKWPVIVEYFINSEEDEEDEY